MKMCDTEVTSSAAYFSSYNDLSVHELMLEDRPRTLAYQKFFETYRDQIKDKVVMDVGAGTGILSLFAAAAGAKKVYAIEASDVATICDEIAQENGFGSVIEVIHGAVEDISLPTESLVDVIVSEWMGFYLLHESMLDSVLTARDRFLAPGGIMAPSHAALYLSPVDMTEHFDDRAEKWSNIYGFDFSPVASLMNAKEVSEPLVQTLDPSFLLSEAQRVLSLDLNTVSVEEIRHLCRIAKFSMQQDSRIHGFALWFNVSFTGKDFSDSDMGVNKGHAGMCKPSGADSVGGDVQKMPLVNEKGDASSRKMNDNVENCIGVCKMNSLTSPSVPELPLDEATASTAVHQEMCVKREPVVLHTGPRDPPTHWKQTVIFLPQTIMVEKGIDVYCCLTMAQDGGNKRHYNITLELQDQDGLDMEEEEEDDADVSDVDSDGSTDHPVPCSCGSDRCRLIAALVEKYDMEHDELEGEAEMVEYRAEVEAAQQLDADIEDGGWYVDSNTSALSTEEPDQGAENIS